MNKYRYKAVRMDGRICEDVILAENEQQALAEIRAAQLFPLELLDASRSSVKKSEINPGKLTISEPLRIQFTKSLYTLVKAGVPILGALKVIREQTEDKSLQIVVESCIKDISVGKSFSDSLSIFPGVFSQIYIQSVKIGEISGTLEETLRYLTHLEEKEYRLKRDLKKSLRYPAITFLAIIIAFFVFTLFVFPQFMPLFQATQMELPLPTRMLMGISIILKKYWWLLLLLMASVVTAVYRFVQSPNGRLNIERYLFQMPILGRLIKFSYLARYVQMLFTLFKSGISILPALEIVKNAIDSKVLAAETEKIIQSLSSGKSFTEQLQHSDVFDPFAIQMLKIGEESGALEAMLEYVGKYYEKEVNDMVENMNTIIEPVLTVLLGIMVIFLALSLFLPMWNLMGTIK